MPAAATVPTASFDALGTTALVAVADAAALAGAEALLRDELAAIDAACSRFRPDSELGGLNAAGGRETAVGPLLREAIDVALRAAAQTDGAVDPTVGTAMCDLGYDRDFALVAGSGEGIRVRSTPAPGWSAVRLDAARGTVTLPPGVRLDLGATAKALAADRAAAAIARATGAATLVSLGGDVAVAGAAPQAGWPVRVGDDHRAAGEDDEVVAVHAGGLATSSTTVRRWGRPGDVRHHIVDPGRGAPAYEAWRTVSVAAGSCVEANVASTAAIVRGRGAPDWLAARGLPARLVAGDGRVVRVGGWPEAGA